MHRSWCISIDQHTSWWGLQPRPPCREELLDQSRKFWSTCRTTDQLLSRRHIFLELSLPFWSAEFASFFDWAVVFDAIPCHLSQTSSAKLSRPFHWQRPRSIGWRFISVEAREESSRFWHPSRCLLPQCQWWCLRNQRLANSWDFHPV